MTAAERHENQHLMIAERAAAYDAAPKRTGADKIRRREYGKRAWWTLTGHMRSMHGVGGQNPFLFKTWEEVTAWHDRLHDPSAIYEGTPLPHGIACRCHDCEPSNA